MSDAIARRRPASSLDTVSPLHGLRRGSVTTLDLVAQSVAAVAPAGVLLAQTGGLLAHAGSFAFLGLILTSVTVVLVAMAMSVFARRISASGGIYTYVTRGLGPVLGMTAGVSVAIGYGSMAIDTLRGGVRRIGDLLAGATGWPTDGVLPTALVLVCGVAITVVIALGPRTSTRTMLVVEVVAVTAILAVSVAVFARTGWDVAALIPDPGAAPPLSSFAAAIGLALVGFVGFESSAALGPESRRPLSSVPRALVWTAATLAVVYLFSVAAQLSAADGDQADRPTSLLADAEHIASAPWIEPLIEAVIAASWLACTLALTNALVRLVFCMAREGVLPMSLGATSKRFATPHRAAIVVGVLLAVGTLTLQWSGRDSLFGEVISLASMMGFIIAYLLLCAAATPYLLRLREFSLREAWPAFLGTLALAAVMLTEVLGAAADGPAALIVVCALIATATIAHTVRCRRESALRTRLGLYDTPIASDALSVSGEGRRVP